MALVIFQNCLKFHSPNNFEISLVVFMPNITTNHAITYTNKNNDLEVAHPRVVLCLPYSWSNWNLDPGHIGGKQALSPLHHPLLPAPSLAPRIIGS